METKTATKELVLGEKYTDRYTGTTGTALEMWAYLNGCFLVCLTFVKDGEAKHEYSFDTYLDEAFDGEAKLTVSVRRPDVMATRAAEILGKKYRCTISGFEGTATGVRFILNGTEQISIQPRGTDPAVHPKSLSIDSGQCELIVPPVPVAAAPRVGGPNGQSPF